ncbi:hypothetical protein LZ31DRAFT_551949 [Colletotrichum somersetense]|nr:hypothetical protein LZ31DRAFT_551949 [Colletotrichum somersetense]
MASRGLMVLAHAIENPVWCLFFGGVVLSRCHRSMSLPLFMWRRGCATGLALADAS